ncbi:MAG: hypothetical protein ACFFC3_11875 [Candidatus Odinarchaeota archaeon]
MDYWGVIDNLYNVTLSFTFFILMILMFYIGRKGIKGNNKYGGISTIICGVCFLIFGYYNSIVRFFPYPFNGFMIWWIWINLLMNFTFIAIVKKTIKKMDFDKNKVDINEGKKHSLQRYIEKLSNESPYREDLPVKKEMIRKSFHLMGFLLILSYFGFFTLLYPIARIINDTLIVIFNQIPPVYEIIWGPLSLYPFGSGDFQAIIYLIMMGLIGSLIFAIIADIIRVIRGPEYSIFNYLTHSMLRNKEINATGPQIYIITGFIFSYMLYMAGIIHILVFFTGLLVACLSDAAAALIGKRYGKHKVTVRSKDTKSIEGFLAGMIVAYVIGLILVGPIYAIIGAIIFFITDYFPIYTADNILNPIFIPLGIQIFIFLLRLPVGWF